MHVQYNPRILFCANFIGESTVLSRLLCEIIWIRYVKTSRVPLFLTRLLQNWLKILFIEKTPNLVDFFFRFQKHLKIDSYLENEIFRNILLQWVLAKIRKVWWVFFFTIQKHFLTLLGSYTHLLWCLWEIRDESGFYTGVVPLPRLT